jgi:membrane protease subunit HflK
MPIVEKVQTVDVLNVYDFSYASSMLTQDENIVSVELAVQYKVGNAKDFLFNVDKPIHSLKEATASALRFVIGHTNLSEILTTGRDEVRQKVKKILQETLSVYKSGITLLDVVIQPATPPEAVKAAFDDAIKAQEDEQRYKNQAESYERKILPKAQGRAKRILEEANAYKEQIILKAKGDVSLFLELLPLYIKSPEVTIQRLYFDMMEKVLGKVSKIIIDDNIKSITMLPVDKIIELGAAKSIEDYKNKSSNKRR